MARTRWFTLAGSLLLLALALQISWPPTRLAANHPAPQLTATSLPLSHYLPLVWRAEEPQSQVTLTISEQLRWLETAPISRSYDLVIVADYSGSNTECWGNRNQCGVGSRRIDGEAAALRTLYEEFLIRQNSQGADHRLGLVQSQGTVGRIQIPLSTTTTLAISRFQQLVGSTANPRTIPSNEFMGYSPIATGLLSGLSLFDSAPRSVDANGNPVERVVVLFMDDTSNVFVDAPAAGLANSRSTPPFHCRTLDGGDDVADPQLQYTCPAPNHPNNTTGVRPPLRALVEIADAARTNQQVRIAALSYGSVPAESAELRRLHLIAPSDYAYAATPAELSGQIASLIARLGSSCVPGVASARPAAGASVEIFDTNSTLVYSGTLGSAGTLTTTLLDGNYILRASHSQVVAPADPSQAPRTYDRLVTDSQPVPSQSVSFPLMSGSGDVRALLTIADPASAQCP